MAFPTISIHESFAAPTSMYLRNLMSIDTEEMIRAQPMDAVVLIGGCDKTVPAQLMGAASAGIPAIQLVTGSMLTGSHRGERVGACTDCRRYWAQVSRRRHRRRRDGGRQRPAGGERGHLLGDGHGQHDGVHRRGARHDDPRRRVAAGGHRRSHPDCRGDGRAGGAGWRETSSRSTGSSRRPRSRTRCACCSRSAARPTASCT